ncbi:hypothetical protein ONE63_011094 [Megalurothrips usitatus]|uniref:Uncharacterized protein n=1 Tax=Megalurothrips usitatus TaxID=439358 RepID=A0AAV7XJ66_9NEOP|nr:hypothetical protein ONE63_011094 [Megalurothrips usitatus]
MAELVFKMERFDRSDSLLSDFSSKVPLVIHSSSSFFSSPTSCLDLLGQRS